MPYQQSTQKLIFDLAHVVERNRVVAQVHLKSGAKLKWNRRRENKRILFPILGLLISFTFAGEFLVGTTEIRNILNWMRIGELEIKPFQNIQNELDEFVENNLLLNMQCLSLPLIEHKETYNWEYLYLVLPILGVPIYVIHFS